MATTTPNYGWSVPTSTDLVKDGATAIETLGDSVDATVKALNPETTLGDISYRSATANTNTRLGIGSTSQVLTVAGGVPTWATPSASNSFTLLSTTTLSGASTTISSINQTYKDLYVVVYGVTMASSSSNFLLAPNGVTNKCNWVMTYTTDAGPAVASTWEIGGYWRLTSQSNQKFDNNGNIFTFTINDYSSTTVRKAMSAQAGFLTQSSANGSNMSGGAYMETTAVSSLVFSQASNFSTGTVLVYGVK